MPTLKPPGLADWNFTRIGIPDRLDRAGILEAILELSRAMRCGGLDRRGRWLRVFDPALRDLAKLPVGLFDEKALLLPRKLVPSDEAQLRRFCRGLIDRGDDEVHIGLVLAGWPPGPSLDDHVSALWTVRVQDRLFFEQVVRGRHGRALRRLKQLVAAGLLSEKEGRDLVHRQALLWAAHDAQMVASRARVSMTMPLGALATFTMRVVKAGTILRLMRGALAALKVICGQYQTAEEEREQGANGAKPKRLLARTIGAQVEKQVSRNANSVENYRAQLDDGMTFVRQRFGDIEKGIASLNRYQTENLPVRRDRSNRIQPLTNRPRTLHAVWYSDLSPAAGTAVALFRFALAELHLREMVNAAADAPGLACGSALGTLPALPDDEPTLMRLRNRVMDLLNGARRVHLRDPDWRSRSKKQQQRRQRPDPSWSDRDPSDKAGERIVSEAERFIREMGRRPIDAHQHRLGGDHRLWTYWAMDIVPELRLAM